MANTEISRQVAERRGKIELGIVSPSDTTIFETPFTPREENTLKRRWTPKVQSVMESSLRGITEAIEDNDPMSGYVFSVDYVLASTYGERGIGIVDWDEPPVIGTPEMRYLVVLNNIARSVYESKYDEAQQIMKGITATYGSNGDSGGFPCNPELLVSIQNVDNYLQSIFQTRPLGENDSKWGKAMGSGIHEVVRGYSSQDRNKIVETMGKLDSLRTYYFMQEKIEMRLDSIHPVLGNLAGKFFR